MLAEAARGIGGPGVCEIEAHHRDLVQLIIRLCDCLAHLCGGATCTGGG